MTSNLHQLDVDLHGVCTSVELHDRLASTFSFPDYYGRNWDAFDECIADYGPFSGILKIHGWDELRIRLPQDAELLHSCLDNFAKSVNLRVVWV